MLNVLKRTVPFLIVFVLSGLIISRIIGALENGCSALGVYAAIDLDDTFRTLIAIGATLVVGMVLYFFIRGRVTQNKLRFKYIYWSALPLFVLFMPIYKAVDGLRHRNIEQSICQKSSGPGSMMVQSANLNLKEYTYLKNIMAITIPDLPRSATGIDIKYSGDDFLGDFMLNIRFTCSVKEKIIKDQNWGILSVDKAQGTQRVFYSSHMD